jgi:GNAT superfamily N-acetyltransferase
MDVRPAVLDDAPALARVHIRTWQEAYVGLIDQGVLDGLSDELANRTDWWRTHLTSEPPLDVWVGVSDEGTVEGFVTFGESRDERPMPTTGEVRAIYTRERVWGTGLGSALWDAATAQLAARGCVEATLWVLDTNVRARRFYERKGWTADGATQVDDVWGATVTEVRYRGMLR